MRILKLHHPVGHAYWNADEYRVELPDGSFINIGEHLEYAYMGYRIYSSEAGVFAQQCSCGSGYGKKELTHVAPVLIVPASKYDKIEYIGPALEMSDTLKQDLIDNQIK